MTSDEIRIVKSRTLASFIHNLKFKTATYQAGGRGEGMTGLFVGMKIYTYEPRLWYKPIYWLLQRLGLAFQGAILKP